MNVKVKSIRSKNDSMKNNLHYKLHIFNSFNPVSALSSYA